MLTDPRRSFWSAAFWSAAARLAPALAAALVLASLAAPPAHAGGGREIITHEADGTDIWQTEFDVRDLPPGTWNIIISARDAAGNVGVSGPYNLRIDPEAGLPGTRIVYPSPGQVVRGDVSIVGVTHAPFGVMQVYARINEDGDFFMVEGEEFWNLIVPAGALPDGRHSVFARVRDLDGLEGPVSRIDFIVDSAPPTVEILSHEIGSFISGRARIRGAVTDPNGIAALYISGDGENFEPLSLSGRRRDTTREFSFTINTRNYDDGPVVYFVRAVDSTGYEAVEPVLFFVNNVPPLLEILSPGPGEDIFGETQVAGRVVSLAGLSEFFYEWEGRREDIPRFPGDPHWAVTIPVSGARGNFRVTAVDITGNVSRQTIQLRDRRQVRAPLVRIDSPAPSGRMVLAYDQPIYGHVSPGFVPYAVRLEAGWLEATGSLVMAQPAFRIDPHVIPQGRSTLVLRALDEFGLEGPALSLRVERAPPPAREEWEPPFALPPLSRILVDSHPGRWADGPWSHPWAGSYIDISGSLPGYAPGQALEYRLRWDEPWRRAAVEAAPAEEGDGGEAAGAGGGGARFSARITLAGRPAGHVPLEMRVARPGGAADFPVFLPVNRSDGLPSIGFLSPGAEFGAIHGMVTTAGIVDSAAPIVEMGFSIDGGYEFEPLGFVFGAERSRFSLVADYSRLYGEGLDLVIRALDRAGNLVQASPRIIFDNSDDLPVLILNSPLQGELVMRDFELSGLAYDDDGVAAVYWRILRPSTPWEAPDEILARAAEDGFELEFARVETAQNFAIPVGIGEVENGFNILEMFAADIFGTHGELERRVLRVSHSAPVTVALEPPIDVWNSGNVMVRGTSFDLNAISDVFVSMDNGVSWQRADVVSTHYEPGGEWGMNLWEINLNTRAYADGTYAMLIRAIDGFGVGSYSSGVINIDNTPPEVDVAFPREGSLVSTHVYVAAQVFDNMSLRGISVQLANIYDPAIQETRHLEPALVVMERFDIAALPEGSYILKVSAVDYSGNETIMIRNISLQRGEAAADVAIINPLPGIAHSGPVVVSGRVSGAFVPDVVILTVNGEHEAAVPVDRFGIFRHEMPEGSFGGEPYYVFGAFFQAPGGDLVMSAEHPVAVRSFGPALAIESHSDGDVITGRPWLSGRAFMASPPFDEERPPTRQERELMRPRLVELSFDNGRSFVPARGRENWRFRLEADYLPGGLLPVVVRATFNDGSAAARRILLTVDTALPSVATIGPAENTFHRHGIMVFGSAQDNYELDSVEISLRQGSKHLYAVPGFVEGLFIDVSVLGGLLWSTGIGLTFFDDNVRLQLNLSQAPEGRFEGVAVGGKLVANIWSANLRRWFGPDWEWWTTSIGLGANFSYFMMGEGENPQWMGQFLGQWEIIKADMSFFFPRWRYFGTVSLYMEPGIWFAASDVDFDVNPDAWRTRFTIGFGLRFSLF